MRATKSVLFALALALASCLVSCQQQYTWRVQRGVTSSKEHEAAKLVHSSTYLDLQFFRQGSNIDCFLIVKGSPIAAKAKKAHEANLKIRTNTGIFTAPLIRHAGGQKFSFTNEAKELLFRCLEEKQPFELTLESYTMTIDTEGFEESYKQFCKTPFIENPFRLPF